MSWRSLRSILSSLSLVGLSVNAQQPENRTIDDSYTYSSARPDGIQYSSGWTADSGPVNAPDRKDNTLHASTTPGANLVYFFQGDAIYYYADRDVPHGLTRVAVDDEQGDLVNSTASTIQYQQLLWSKTGLGPGDHSFVVSHAGSQGQYMGLDYLIVESDHGFTPNITGPTASVVPKEAVIVDDADPSLIWSEGWDPVLPSQQWATYFGDSMHRTQTPGSSVTLKFNGTAAWYFSDMNPSHGRVNITIDGVYSYIVDGYASPPVQQRLIWSKTDLADKEHTLILTYQDPPGSWGTLDFFSQPAQPKAAKSNIGAIVGGAVGGVILVAILCILGFLYRRRRRSAFPDETEKQDGPDIITAQPNVTPFTGYQAPYTVSPSQPNLGYVGYMPVDPSTDSSVATEQVPPPRREKGSQVRVTPVVQGTSSYGEPASSSVIGSEWTDAGTLTTAADAPPAYVHPAHS
ncbi:hypothetical protein BDV93DRAFT_527780 [Ceratobasidium sp. AG-I]|nr:hypothetical protein BDV93DRAFT_527780 [Ceratobasidium sp. AG-I]